MKIKTAHLKAWLLVAASAGLLAAATPASAAVVTFDDATGNSLLHTPFTNGQSFSDQGLTFTNNGSGFMYVWDGSSPNSNGTNNNIFGFGSGDTETITKTGGGTFSLQSIDMAISWYDSNPNETITINGNPLTITQTLTTYNLNLNNVTSVNISGVPSGSGYWLADNIVYTSASAPGPAPGAGFAGLAALALGGLYARTRRA